MCTQNFDRIAQLTSSSVEDNYADIFDDSLGTLPGVQHLEVDPSGKPVVTANRRIPIYIRPELKTELERLVQKGVITRVVARSSSKEKNKDPGSALSHLS